MLWGKTSINQRSKATVAILHIFCEEHEFAPAAYIQQQLAVTPDFMLVMQGQKGSYAPLPLFSLMRR